jgi:Zn-dependent protease
MFLLQLLQINPVLAVLWIGAILLGITVHEASHSYAAHLLGDPTPEQAGRRTFDPLAHLDPIGTILIFLVGFGWGRPAPFNPTYFRHYKRDIAYVALAGPVSNLAIAVFLIIVAALFGIRFFPFNDLIVGSDIGFHFSIFEEIIGVFLYTNVILAVFNLIPIPPLDGSKVLYAFLPHSLDEVYARFEQMGPILLLLLLLFGGATVFSLVNPITNFVVHLLK